MSNTLSSLWLAIRSITWAILLPGLFAGYVPWRYFGLAEAQWNLQDPIQLAGLFFLTIGVILLAICIWEFAHSGRGTLSPVDPPKELVVRGLYRYVRNPMYLSVTTIILGEFILTRSIRLFIYWIIWFVCVNLFVIFYEEPALRRQFGDSYERYTQEVGRWVPSFQRRRQPN